MDAIGLGERAGHEETCDLLAAHMGLEKVGRGLSGAGPENNGGGLNYVSAGFSGGP
jgi:hypothetical protein